MDKHWKRVGIGTTAIWTITMTVLLIVSIPTTKGVVVNSWPWWTLGAIILPLPIAYAIGGLVEIIGNV